MAVGDTLPEDTAYFHARYRRENPTTPKKDFEILPRVEGRGRYLGADVGIRTTDHGRPLWFGEGELKVHLDDDREWPTLVGTGTEDLVGSAWGLGRFDHLYQGAPLARGRTSRPRRTSARRPIGPRTCPRPGGRHSRRKPSA